MMTPNVSFPTSFSGLLLACSLLFTPHTTFRVGEIISFGDVFFLAAAVVGVVERLLSDERLPVVPAYILAAVLMTISYLANYQVDIRQHDLLFFIVIVNAVFVPLGIMMVRLRSLPELNFLIICWTLSAFLGAAIAVAYTFGLAPFYYDYYWHQVGRVQGLTTHPNLLGLNAALATPGLLLMFMLYKSLLIRAVILAMLFVVYMAVNYTGSRSALGAFALIGGTFGVLVLLFTDLRHRLAIIMAGVLIMLIGLFYFVFVGDGLRPESALGRFFIADTTRSDALRESAAAAGWHDLLNSPVFGEGFHLMRFVHNIYLQALHSAGVVGAAGYFITLFLPLWMLITARSPAKERGPQIALVAASIGLLVAAWWWAGYTELNISIVFALTLYAAFLYRMQLQKTQIRTAKEHIRGNSHNPVSRG